MSVWQYAQVQAVLWRVAHLFYYAHFSLLCSVNIMVRIVRKSMDCQLTAYALFQRFSAMLMHLETQRLASAIT